MPELPEVETVKRVLVQWCQGKTIKDVYCFYDNLLVNTTFVDFKNALSGKKIEKIDRQGKYLIFQLDSSLIFTSHLRMEGKWHYGYLKGNDLSGLEFDLEAKLKGVGHKHAHLLIEFTDLSCIIYEDTRKFGRIEIINELPLKNLGKEIFDIDADYLKNHFAKSKFTLKQLLLDQSIVAGFGNIYADELAFYLKLLPSVKVKDIPLKKIEELIKYGQAVLNKAIDLGGSSVSTYHFANFVDGKFQSELQVYGRQNQPCLVCGYPISKVSYLGRGTSICFACQKGDKKIIGVTGKMGSGKSTLCKIFEEKGYLLLDTDKMTKDLQENELLPNIIRLFKGHDILTNNELDRQKMRQAITPFLLKKLEDLIYPVLIKKIHQIILLSEQNIILDVPLLYHSRLNEICDQIIVVKTSQEIRMKRLAKRNLSKEQIELFDQNNQIPNDSNQIIIQNDLGISELRQEIKKSCRFF